MAYVSVKDCGAVGDGVTDDTSSIQAALNTALEVEFPVGDYLISNALTLRSGHHLRGAGYAAKVFTTTANKNLISASSKSDIVIESIRFVGINSSQDVQNGNGLFFSGCSRITVRDCILQAFGDSSNTYNVGCAIIFYINCNEITVEDNFIDGGEGLGQASDILLYSNVGNAYIANNRCYSANSQGIYVNPVSPVGKVIIQGNICKNHLRHGIAPTYTGHTYIDTIVMGNICIDNGWTGIYANFSGTGGGTLIISNNVIDVCGGGATGGDASLTGGLLVSAALPVTISGNQIYNTGRDSSGASRAGEGHGIRCNTVKNVVITGNTVQKSTNTNLFLYLGAQDVNVTGNDFIDAGVSNVHVEQSGASATAFVFCNNRVLATGVDADGIYLAVLQGKNVIFQGNVIHGSKAATTKTGFKAVHSFDGMITHNIIENWDRGVDLGTALAVNCDGRCIFGYNQINNNTTGLKAYIVQTTDWFFSLENQFLNNTTLFDGSGGYNRLLYAISLYPRKVFYSSAAPGNGTWAQGDKVLFDSPSAGQFEGQICTTGGSSAVWKNFGAISS